MEENYSYYNVLDEGSEDLYKITGVGLDVSNLNYESNILKEKNSYDYIHTNISSNNSYQLCQNILTNEIQE